MITSPALVRTVGAAIGITISIATIVSVPLAVWWGLWHGLYDWFGGRVLVGFSQDSVGVLSQYPPFSWSGEPIPYPPSPIWILVATAKWMLLAIAGLALVHLVTPIRAKVKSICGYIPQKVDREHPMQLFLNQMARRHGLRLRIRLLVIPVAGVTAFVLTSPLRGHHVVISQGLAQKAPAEIIQWILAHEVGHIVHGDTASATLWMLVMRSVRLFDRLKQLAIVAMFQTMFAIPLFRLILFPFYLLACTIMAVGRIGGRIGGTVFILFDRWASRHMEYRADAFAARFVGPGPGERLFQVLDGPFEPNFRLFATHPSPRSRINALQELRHHTNTQINLAKASPTTTQESRNP